MVGCPWLKAALVRAGNFSLFHLARLPTRDASNGFRLFSRRVMDDIVVESDRGFCYSIELLVKCHRLGWRIGEVPARWFERAHGTSRFQVVRWLPAYLRWYLYAFATTYLRRPARDRACEGAVAHRPERAAENRAFTTAARRHTAPCGATILRQRPPRQPAWNPSKKASPGAAISGRRGTDGLQ